MTVDERPVLRVLHCRGRDPEWDDAFLLGAPTPGGGGIAANPWGHGIALARTRAVLAAVDALRPAEVAALFAPYGSLVLGNGDPLIGRPAIVAGLRAATAGLAGLHQRFVNAWHVGADTVAETVLVCAFRGGGTAAIPATWIWRTSTEPIDPEDPPPIEDCRLYADLAPLRV
jgi:hypothetical protein